MAPSFGLACHAGLSKQLLPGVRQADGVYRLDDADAGGHSRPSCWISTRRATPRPRDSCWALGRQGDINLRYGGPGKAEGWRRAVLSGRSSAGPADGVGARRQHLSIARLPESLRRRQERETRAPVFAYHVLDPQPIRGRRIRHTSKAVRHRGEAEHAAVETPQ